MLNTPLEDGDKKIEFIRLIKECRIPYTYYQEGDFDKTRESIETVVRHYDAFKAAHPVIKNDQGLADEVLQAKLYLFFIDFWKTSPLRVLPENVKLKVESVDGTPATDQKTDFASHPTGALSSRCKARRPTSRPN